MATDRTRSRFRWVRKNLASIPLRFGGDHQTDIASLGGREYVGILAPSDDDTYTQKLCLKVRGLRSCWAATYTHTRSSFNYIYEIEGGALLRFQKNQRNRDAYLREIESNRTLARARLSPAVYATVFLRVSGDEDASMPVGKDDDTVVGVLMDKYEASLENLDEPNIAKLFIEHDTEDALVDLYAHAAAYVRCVDTKPANVVWKIGDGGKPVLGLIDVDPAFCCAASDPHSTLVVLPLIGRAGVSGLSRALRKASEDWNAVIQVGSDGKARVPAVLVAAVSLLIFCVEAATGDPDDAYPYIRIADALLEYSVVIDKLIKLDGKDEEWRATASSRLIHYCGRYLLRTEGEGTCDWRSAIGDALSRPARALPDTGVADVTQPGLKKHKKQKSQRSARRSGCKTPRSRERMRERIHDHGART